MPASAPPPADTHTDRPPATSAMPNAATQATPPAESTPRAGTSAAWHIAVGLLAGALGFELLQASAELPLFFGGAPASAIATDLFGSLGRAALLALLLVPVVWSRKHWTVGKRWVQPRLVWAAVPLIAATHVLEPSWMAP
jgi:hypothetical protein